MIIALLCSPLIGWTTYWLIHQSMQVTPVAATGRRTPRGAAPTGPEDDPGPWLAPRGAWTAADEYQLIRLLKNSAP